VRALLLRLLPGSGPESDEWQLHTRLREHFHNLAINQGQPAAFDWQAQVEEAYHALALGDPQPAIDCGIAAQRSNVAAWEPLLEAVAQAPVELIPANTERRAYDATVLAQRHRRVLYTWLVTARQGDQAEVARLQHNLGEAYRNLPGGDRQTNLERAIECYKAALQVRTREAYPAQWAATQNNLGAAYWDLPGGDKQANLERAIGCYEAALQICRALRLDHLAQVISRNLERARAILQAL
jgi:tetratricopeptide (TPR) repeat protein